MKQVKVIAQRYKVGQKVLIICGIILLALGALLLNKAFDNKFMGSIGVIGGVIILAVGLYYKFSPREVILQSEDKLLFCFLFRTVAVPISSIEYVSYSERSSAFRGAGMNLSWFTVHRENQDVRNMAIVYKENGFSKTINLYEIEGASAVKIAIETLMKERAEGLKE